MPGTGPLRRSGAPVREKAIVDKSRIAAGRLRSPRSVFLAWFRMSFTVRVLLLFLDGLSHQNFLPNSFLRDIGSQKTEVLLVDVTQQ